MRFPKIVYSDTMAKVAQHDKDIEALQSYQQACEKSHEAGTAHRRKSDAEMITISKTLNDTLATQRASQETQEAILATLKGFKEQIEEMAKYTPAMRRAQDNYEVVDNVKGATIWTISKAKDVAVWIAAIAVAYYHILEIIK